MAEDTTKSISDYFPIQNYKQIDYQHITRYVVQMWFKVFGTYFHVVGTKKDLDLRR